MKFNIIMRAVMLSFLVASAQIQADTTNARDEMDAIEKLIEEEFAAGNAGDVEALLSLRTDDAVEIYLGAPPLVGKDAIRVDWTQDSDVIEQFTDRSVEEIILVGDWAFVRFSFTHTVTPAAGGDPIMSKNQAMWVIRRQSDASWKIHWEMVNSSEAKD